MNITAPKEGQFAPYMIEYVGRVPNDGQVLTHMADNVQKVKDFVHSLPKDRLDTRHEAGEWTVKEVLCHIIDTERVMSYRALRFARNDSTALPGFEQDDYVPESFANARSLDDIFAEYTAVRQASIALFESLDASVYERHGVASGHKMTVRAAAYIIVGHELHHLESIRENYG